MATNDKFRFIAKMTYLGQNCQNVLHFLQTAGSGGAAQLGNEFIASYEASIRTVQNVGVLHVGSSTINLDDNEDFADFVYGTPRAGSVSGEGLPSYAAWTYRKSRTSRSFRNGSMRIPGVSESSAVGNDAAAAFSTTLQTLGTDLSADLDDGTNTWLMIIPRYTGTPPVLTSWDTVQAVVYSHIGSQVSRKVGQGT